MSRSALQRATSLIAATILFGCAGEGPPSGGGEETWFDQIQNDVFDQSCLAGACHNSATRAGNLSLAAGESYDQLVNIEPDNSAARDAGLLRVLPGSVAESFLVNKVTGDLQSGEGAQMPIGAPPIPAAQVANIAAWIEAGASETDPPPGNVPSPPDPSAPSYSDVQQVFDASCVSSACHNDGTQAGGLSLSRGSSYAAIVGIEPTNANARDDGLLLVAPREPSRSFLLSKLTGDLAPGDGSQMPLTGAALPDASIELIADWIAAGAPPDSAG